MSTTDKRSVGIREARKLAAESARILKYRGNRLNPAARKACTEGQTALVAAIHIYRRDRNAASEEAVMSAAANLTGLLEKNKEPLKAAAPVEYAIAIGVAILLAVFVRFFVFEAFRIPTGSMIPTVNISDQVFVNKFKYGLRIPFTHYDIVEIGEPERGEVVVFDYPVPGDNYNKAFLKRVVGLPGDRVRLENNRLHINGRPVHTKTQEGTVDCGDDNLAGCWCERQTETLGTVRYTTQHVVGPRPGFGQICRNDPDWPVNNPMSVGSPVSNKDFPDIVVPEGHVLCMGDNRDNSSDGRYWGFVPIENLRGNAVVFWWPPSKMFRLVE